MAKISKETASTLKFLVVEVEDTVVAVDIVVEVDMKIMEEDLLDIVLPVILTIE
jgi:hypothetical protein